MAFFLIIAIFLFSAFVPTAWVDGLPLCIFKHLTGWDCPGCGLTRAFMALFHGQFLKAISFNALAPGMALFLWIYFAGILYSRICGRSPQWFTAKGSRLIGGLFLFLLFGQWFWKTGLRVWGMFS